MTPQGRLYRFAPNVKQDVSIRGEPLDGLCAVNDEHYCAKGGRIVCPGAVDGCQYGRRMRG